MNLHYIFGAYIFLIAIEYAKCIQDYFGTAQVEFGTEENCVTKSVPFNVNEAPTSMMFMMNSKGTFSDDKADFDAFSMSFTDDSMKFCASNTDGDETDTIAQIDWAVFWGNPFGMKASDPIKLNQGQGTTSPGKFPGTHTDNMAYITTSYHDDQTTHSFWYTVDSEDNFFISTSTENSFEPINTYVTQFPITTSSHEENHTYEADKFTVEFAEEDYTESYGHCHTITFQQEFEYPPFMFVSYYFNQTSEQPAPQFTHFHVWVNNESTTKAQVCVSHSQASSFKATMHYVAFTEVDDNNLNANNYQLQVQFDFYNYKTYENGVFLLNDTYFILEDWVKAIVKHQEDYFGTGEHFDMHSDVSFKGDTMSSLILIQKPFADTLMQGITAYIADNLDLSEGLYQAVAKIIVDLVEPIPDLYNWFNEESELFYKFVGYIEDYINNPGLWNLLWLVSGLSEFLEPALKDRFPEGTDVYQVFGVAVGILINYLNIDLIALSSDPLIGGMLPFLNLLIPNIMDLLKWTVTNPIAIDFSTFDYHFYCNYSKYKQFVDPNVPISGGDPNPINSNTETDPLPIETDIPITTHVTYVQAYTHNYMEQCNSDPITFSYPNDADFPTSAVKLSSNYQTTPSKMTTNQSPTTDPIQDPGNTGGSDEPEESSEGGSSTTIIIVVVVVIVVIAIIGGLVWYFKGQKKKQNEAQMSA